MSDRGNAQKKVMQPLVKAPLSLWTLLISDLPCTACRHAFDSLLAHPAANIHAAISCKRRVFTPAHRIQHKSVGYMSASNSMLMSNHANHVNVFIYDKDNSGT